MTVAETSRLATAPPRARVAVVGGGLLGMTLALRLAQRGRAVTLLESASTLGGLAQPWRIGEATWDRHYHVILGADRALRALLEELSLGDEIVWRTARTGFYTGARFHDMTTVADFLRFPPLRPLAKLRLGLAILRAGAIRDGRALEAITARQWLSALCGEDVYRAIWQPLLRAKVGANEPDVSAAFIWAIIRRLFGARGTHDKRERFGHVAGGYARIIAVFTRALEERGVAIRTGCAVERIGAASRGGVDVEEAGGAVGRYDACVVTVPAPLAARLCSGIGEQERERLAGVAYQGIVCASMLLRAPLGPYYVTNITDDGFPFSALVEMTTIVDPSEIGGCHLVYLPKYVASDSADFLLDDAVIRERFLAGVARMYPGFCAEHVVAFRVSRVRAVFPITTLRYSDRIPSMRTAVPGLTIVNSAHILNGTLNANETVDLAERAMPIVCGSAVDAR